MTSIDINTPGPQSSPAVSATDNATTPPVNSGVQPSAESVSAFEALVAGEDTTETRATATNENGEATETGTGEPNVTIDDIRDGIRQQVIRDIITKQTTIDI